MRTIKVFIFLLFIIGSFHNSMAQQTAYFDDVRKDIDIAKELYNKNKFISSYRQFEKIQKRVDAKSELYSEAEFYKSVSALHAGYRSGDKLIRTFVETYPESPYINSALFNLGKSQFEKRQYSIAVRTFAKVDRNDLSENERIELQYQNGFANLEQGNTEVAYREFMAIRNSNNLYSKPATYYCAHIQYLNEEYDAALEGFTALNNDPAYSQVIPLYVSHIYYKQQKYSEVVNYTTSIIDDVQEEHQTELSKIVGDSYFHLRQYENAIPYLETYFKSSGPKTREENYILGFCYYHTGKYTEAADLLQKAATGEDEMTQNAYYHLADCFIKLDEKEKAKTAYNAASEFDFNPEIKEDALFSYAKLTYELSYSPFNETIKAFDRYIAEYPNSPKNAEAYKILVDVYMVTKNYKDAIESIDKIQNKTPDILKAYQRVTFYRGLELFNNLAYNEAIEYFDESLANGSYNKEIKSRTLYWKSEALYRVGDYDNSIASYNQFARTSSSATDAEILSADYNMGYAYLKSNDKEAAQRHFQKYVDKMQGKRTPKIADAYNRIGDYYFSNTNYTQAIYNYEHAYSIKMLEADYALLQIAFCQGLQRQQMEKITNLNKLLREFPESDYYDDALYELGRANERIGNNSEAVKQYLEIAENHPHSNYYRNALLQLGLVNYNNGDFNKALSQYKEVAENFKGTPEANSALQGIKNCYVELNNVDAYFAYVRQLGGDVSISASEQDQLTYSAAERVYMAGDDGADQQLQQYLNQYPNGAYVTNAHFYLAENRYKEGNYEEANSHYSFVANQADNIFTEQALSRASELTYNAGNYSEALAFFNRLEEKSTGKWNSLRANTGQMRCYLLEDNYQQVIVAAEKVKKSDVTNDALKKESDYAIGKSNYELGNLSSAISPLRDVAKDTKLEQGAEAKYLLAEIYYRENNKAKAEEEIVDFIDKGTPYTYWLGKAFLLLASIYEDNGDQFQAKHTLKSLAENYNDDSDGVKAEAQQRLDVILVKEAQQQQNAVDSSFQMEIKQN
ncbi:tetratricopeptide repeat protein [Draconibacterium sp. IB214405]|uniref:tetratricopeptide repeat protein n=1 Tax=Draconibacterium sp. IB214405 TaxID=3097352 RepID=UPI002A116D39|nr:tetratricopeptide repeat protein [Draconibacterium sp. IB214405]MDX8340050.1 tetratricopeptide repeat protein [Draconibacterium sp. IB214405]